MSDSGLYKLPKAPWEKAPTNNGKTPEKSFISLDPSNGKRDKEIKHIKSTPENTPTSPTTDKTDKRDSTIPATGFDLGTLSDLLAEPDEDIEWVVDGLLPSAGISILAAKPKVGKSTLARHLELCVARGEPFLGRACSAGPVIYLALEEKRAEVARHFGQMGARAEPIFIHTGGPPARALEALSMSILKHSAVLCVIDPMFRIMQIKNGNDYAEVYDKMGPYIDLARLSGCHISFLHHMGKGERGGADDLLGSTAFRATMDTIMMMRRSPEQVRTFETEQRYGEDWPTTVITLDPDTKLSSAIGELADVQLSEYKEQIREYLATTGCPVRERAIWEHIGGDTGKIAKALRQLVGIYDVERTGHGKPGHPYLYGTYVREEVDDIPY